MAKGGTLPLAEREDFICEAKGFRIDCKGLKCKAHIITRKARLIKESPQNFIFVCKAHESWFNLQPLEFWYQYVKDHHNAKFKAVTGEAKFIYRQLLPFIEVEGGGEHIWIRNKLEVKTSKKPVSLWVKFSNYFAKIATNVQLSKKLAAANSVKQ
jgi:hypothetical protein